MRLDMGLDMRLDMRLDNGEVIPPTFSTFSTFYLFSSKKMIKIIKK